MKQFLLMMEGMRIGMGSLIANKLRTMLTMLGVSIGIFAITIIFTLVNSLTYSLNKNLSELGNTVLFVHHFPWTNDAMSNWQKYVLRPMASYNEFLKLKNELNHVDGVAYEARIGWQTVKYRKREVTPVAVRSITYDYFLINSMELAAGRPFNEVEVDGGRAVCVIGSNVASQLFPDSNPLDKEVEIKGKPVKVVGVSAKAGTNVFGSSPDDIVFVPYSFGQRLFDMRSERVDKMIEVKVSSSAWIDRVEDEIIGLMRASRGLRPKADNNFAINKPAMLMNLFASATDYLAFGGVIISIFSILVGGFGIGNIMFSTVKERTFEIGVQKALGATRRFILFQFMFESVMLCFMGGLLGLLLNYGVTLLLQWAIVQSGAGFTVVTSWGSLGLGVAISVAIGLFSGIVPATIASKMDPVESMRS
jgi:putative ABC transport system permease protein